MLIRSLYCNLQADLWPDPMLAYADPTTNWPDHRVGSGPARGQKGPTLPAGDTRLYHLLPSLIAYISPVT